MGSTVFLLLSSISIPPKKSYTCLELTDPCLIQAENTNLNLIVD